MSIVSDISEWEHAQADYVSDEGSNSSERMVRRISGARRMHDVEARWEHLPGGFQQEMSRFKAHVKEIVDGMPPLTDEQLCKLVMLLRLPS